MIGAGDCCLALPCLASTKRKGVSSGVNRRQGRQTPRATRATWGCVRKSNWQAARVMDSISTDDDHDEVAMALVVFGDLGVHDGRRRRHSICCRNTACSWITGTKREACTETTERVIWISSTATPRTLVGLFKCKYRKDRTSFKKWFVRTAPRAIPGARYVLPRCLLLHTYNTNIIVQVRTISLIY